MARILLYDIETAPNLGYVWQKWETNVIEFKNEWYMLSFAYKWLGDKSTKAYSLPDFPLYKKDPENDKELVRKLWELVNEADIIVAHNGNDFDIKKMNSRFIFHGFTPPKPYKAIDTKLAVKKVSGEMSNSLNDLSKNWGFGEKSDTGGFATWKGCMSGDKKAWATMVKYNKHDVDLLEKVYLKIRPWITNHPNVSFFDELLNCCPSCKSEKMQRRGFGYTKTSKYRRYQCQSCGSWSQGKPERIDGLEIR